MGDRKENIKSRIHCKEKKQFQIFMANKRKIHFNEDKMVKSHILRGTENQKFFYF